MQRQREPGLGDRCVSLFAFLQAIGPLLISILHGTLLLLIALISAREICDRQFYQY